MASIDASLKRMNLDYVDIFYSHRPDPNTPFEETMGALVDIVRQGKALYVGISNYDAEQSKEAIRILKEQNVHCLVHQASYSMLNRWTEQGLMSVLEEEGVGMVAFSPLAQGMLTDKYLNGIPQDSRAARATGFLQESAITPEVVAKIRRLNELAKERNQTLAEMALAWLLRKKVVTSVIVGARNSEQLLTNLKALDNLEFSEEELAEIEKTI
jgi:L-glyceraldehyde 3-phosphate reductase